jgi:hypothetical protein
MILANALAEPPCADINKFFPENNFGANSSFHKGYNLLMTSVWLSEHGNYAFSMQLYRLSFEGCLSSFN